MSNAPEQNDEAELAELRALATRLLERITKLQERGLTRANDGGSANDSVKPTLEDHIHVREMRRRRGHRG